MKLKRNADAEPQTEPAAFAKGMPSLESSEYKIHASWRDAPGVAEIHTRDTEDCHDVVRRKTWST